MNETSLHDVMDRASDAIESPHLAVGILAVAQARRTRRRGALAAAGSLVAVAALVAIFAFVNTNGTQEPAPVTPTPTSDGNSESPSPDPPQRWGTQPRWDPRRVDDLPTAKPGTVPGVPEVLEPPESSVPLAAAPIEAALVAIEQDDEIHLLAASGEWRSVELPGRYSTFALSPLGTKLLVRGIEGSGPVIVHDITTGSVTDVGYPAEFEPYDYPSWSWLDEATLLLDTYSGGWLVDAVTAESTRVPYPSAPAAYWAADSAGDLIDSADWVSPPVLTDWSVTPPREVSMRETGRLAHLRVEGDTVVGTSYDGHPFAVIVADRTTLTPEAVLPVFDYDGNYSPGALRPVALRDDGSVLLQVSVFGRGVDGFRLVVWDPDSSDLSVASSTSLPIEQAVVFAEGLLRHTDP